jgi:hypothetical protein
MADLRWGDVLVAAIDACCARGCDDPVCPDELSRLVLELREVSGGMDGVRGKVAAQSLEAQR